MRSQLIIEIGDIMRHKRLTQARAAKLFGVTQPRISDLKRGKIDKFSIDALVTMLAHAGLEVTVGIRPAA